jgi:N-acetylglutamate synthase-like GNAT family acetyltransferase
MSLVPLDDRLEETVVQQLLAHGSGSPKSAEKSADRYRSGAWKLLGWETDGALVGCVGVSRDKDGTVELHSVAVLPEARGGDVGRALVDAIAEIVNAPRLVAETDHDSVGFYRACGFVAEPAGAQMSRRRFRCVRSLDAEADVSTARFLTLAAIEQAIRNAWCAETSDDPQSWSESNPARNQCDVTALLVRELLGGEILIANVVRNGKRIERHAWNRLPSGLELDLTRSQFQDGEQLATPRAAEPMNVGKTSDRYELLLQRVHGILGL